ncbi:hypothetical protein [Micromonospora halophytica]|uniref:Uncharacterized protein n=1 Tax=Micromonospora halophytica TaxID=47864 RepID=A0A1C5I2N7_9ACTN|nr:hypothetical protein [Micromonospora halophytica]SCG52528.1 hypothetical protein GA0070560_107180 [Micromonospora halophytica]
MTKRPRVLPVVATLLIALGLSACGDDPEPGDPSWADGSPKPAATAEAAPPEAPQEAPPSAPRTPSESPSTPPFTMPTKAAGTPAARKVVDAFKAAGLKVTNLRNRTVDCGPDGAGTGCAELLVTDAVKVYVFPTEANATNQTDIWGADAYRRGAVVLSYLGTKTSEAERKRYNDTLATLG